MKSSPNQLRQTLGKLDALTLASNWNTLTPQQLIKIQRELQQACESLLHESLKGGGKQNKHADKQKHLSRAHEKASRLIAKQSLQDSLISGLSQIMETQYQLERRHDMSDEDAEQLDNLVEQTQQLSLPRILGLRYRPRITQQINIRSADMLTGKEPICKQCLEGLQPDERMKRAWIWLKLETRLLQAGLSRPMHLSLRSVSLSNSPDETETIRRILSTDTGHHFMESVRLLKDQEIIMTGAELRNLLRPTPPNGKAPAGEWWSLITTPRMRGGLRSSEPMHTLLATGWANQKITAQTQQEQDHT